MVLYKVLALLLLTGVVILSGCTSLEKVYVCQNGTEVASPDLCLSERKNCRELGGYLCGGEGMCALNWMDSTDSYCCPIKCGTCPNNTDLRDDGNSCPADLCRVKDGKTWCPPPYQCGAGFRTVCEGNQTIYNTSYGLVECCADVDCLPLSGTGPTRSATTSMNGNELICIPADNTTTQPITVYTSEECGLSPPGEQAVVCPKCPEGSTCTCMGNFVCKGDMTFYNDTSYGQLVCCSDGVMCGGTTTVASSISNNRQCIPVNDVNFSANASQPQSISQQPASSCGNGVCDYDETYSTCPTDCPLTELEEYYNTSYNAEITLGIYKAKVFPERNESFLAKLTITNNNDVEIPNVLGLAICILEGPRRGSISVFGVGSGYGEFTNLLWNHVPARTTVEGWGFIPIANLRERGTKFAYCISLNNSYALWVETDFSELK